MKKKSTTIIALTLLAFTSCKNNSEKTVKANAKIFLVLDITVHDSMMNKQYRKGVEPLLRKYVKSI